MSGPGLFTLMVVDQGARLLDAAGELVAKVSLPGGPVLAKALPPKAQVQMLLAGSRLTVHCTEVPRLTAKERREVLQRLAREAGIPQDQEVAHALEPDALAEGGHVLWVASYPRQELEAWLAALGEAGAKTVIALPWQRALLAAGPKDQPSALMLVLERGLARLVYFRGRNLRFTRAFPLPEDLVLPHPDEASLGALSRLATEELRLFLQFLRQKHKGAPPETLTTVGLAAEGLAALEGLGLALTGLAPDLTACLLQGAALERQRKGALDLVPGAFREARKLGLAKALVRGAAAAILLLGAGTKGFLLHQEKVLATEAIAAEAAAGRRRALAREGEEAARLRFGLLRVRRAEARQKQAIEAMERLGVALFQVPEGVDLQKVVITPEPMEAPLHRFQVEGTARTDHLFALGHLASYYDHLKRQPGLRLEALKDVSVGDGAQGAELAQAKFHLEGTAP